VNGKKIKYSDFVQSASLFFALLIAFWIPSYRWILSDFIVGWLLFSILELNFKKRFKANLTDNFTIVVFILQLIFFVLIFSEILFAENKNDVLKNIVQKLSLLIFPLLFALSGKIFKERKILFLKLFVLSNIVMSVICLVYASYDSVSYNNGNFIINIHDINGFSYFRNSLISVFHHRTYFSMYLVFSLAILFFLKEKHGILNSKKKIVLFWLTISFFIIMIFLMSSRAGLLSLLILLSWLVIQKVFFKKNIFKFLTIVAITIFIAVLFQNRRIQNTINQIVLLKKEHNSDKFKNTPARIALWKAAVDIISEDFFIGVGAENFHEKFNKSYLKYSSKNEEFVSKIAYNVHNQFLEEFVLYGIFGFILLLTLFIYPIIISFKRKNYLFLAFLLITGFNFLFESMLNTIAGIVFFTFFMNYFIFVFNDKQIKDF